VDIWGNGEEARDFLYVGDLVDFVERALERQRERFALLNAGSGVAVSVNELARKIVAASGRALALRHDPSKPTIKTSLSLDCSKAAALLGWSPRTSLDAGIALTLDWWRRNVPKSP